MKTPTIGSVSFAPAQVPTDAAELQRFLTSELQKIQTSINLLALGHLDQTNVVPAKPRSGDIRYADGTNWNPGSGQGFYGYYGGAWHFLG